MIKGNRFIFKSMKTIRIINKQNNSLTQIITNKVNPNNLKVFCITKRKVVTSLMGKANEAASKNGKKIAQR